MSAGAGLEIAACAGLVMAGGGESATGALEITDWVVAADALGVVDALGVAEAVATDDNDAAAVVSAFRDRH